MSKGKFNYGQFKYKQNLEVAKYKATKEYNRLFNNMLSEVYDLYMDFSFNLYEELMSMEDSEDSFFSKVCESVSSLCYEKSRDEISEYINSTDIDNFDKSESCNDILNIVFDVYSDEILYYYNTVCNDYLINLLRNRSRDLSNEECFKELAFLDRNFIRMSVHRFNSLFNRVRSSVTYLNDIFIEECTYNMAIKLKDTIIDCVISTLKDIRSSSDVDEIELNEMFNLLNPDRGNSEEKNLGKLEYIDDYKKLNKLAVDNGFEYVRCRGDHGIYKNENGLVVIPQGRSVGKGLSIKIQKAIVSLSEATA